MIGWISSHWRRAAFRIPAVTVLFSIFTGLTAGGVAYYIARTSLIDLAKSRVALVRTERAREITQFIESIRNHLASVAAAPRVKQDLQNLARFMAGMNQVDRKA